MLPCVLGAEDAALLQDRHDLVGELAEPVRGDVRDQDEPVAGVGLHVLVDGGGDGFRCADEVLPAGDLDDHLAQRESLGGSQFPPLPGGGDRVGVHPDAGPALAMVFSPTSGSTSGSGPSGSLSLRSRFHSCSANLMAVWPLTCCRRTCARVLLRLLLGVTEDEGGGRQYQQLVAAPPVRRPADP